MNVRLSSVVLAFLLGLVTLTSSAGLRVRAARAQTAGLTWYVDGNCTVCGHGTMSSPFRTILQSLTFASDGDTILVAQGTYFENLFINAPVTLMGGYAATSPTWARDVVRYETVVASDYRATSGDWNGDWLGSLSIIKDGSTYRTWYSGGNEIDGESIGYSDSPDGVNWFNPLNTPLLEPGSAGAWDEAEVANPFVLATDSGFQMWYVGRNAVGERAIGYAASPDALTWHKHDGNPILRPDSADHSSFGFPTVVQDGPNDFKMWYSGGSRVWLATSSDGLTWTKHVDAPMLSPGGPARGTTPRHMPPV